MCYVTLKKKQNIKLILISIAKKAKLRGSDTRTCNKALKQGSGIILLRLGVQLPLQKEGKYG